MIHALSHALFDTLQTLPILLVVYILLEYLEARQVTKKMADKMEKIGPAAGALVGCIPQCGFAAAASSMYSRKFLSAGTLIAVFLSTSDEALPVLLAAPEGWSKVVPLLAAKLILSIVAGYLFQFTIFRKETTSPGSLDSLQETIDHDCCGHHSHTPRKWAILWQAIRRTLQIGLFLFLIMAVIEFAIEGIGEDALNQILLNGSIFQPLLTALIGLIPGCAVSVILTELFLTGSLSFGAAVAGLATGAGFGYLVLIKECKNWKSIAKIVGCTYLAAAVGGMILQMIVG